MSSFVVVLDACVLVSASLRDTLLRCAHANLYRMQWTEDILEEVRRTLISDIHVPEEKAQRLIDIMRSQFPEAMVTRHRMIIDTMPNDPKDRHVLAAAVASQAQAIVTQNLQHFAVEFLEPLSIEAQSPDDFLTNLFHLYPEHISRIIREQAEDLQHPPISTSELIDILAIHAPKFSELLKLRLVPRHHNGKS